MEFYIIEKLIVTVPVYNARENVTHCQLSVIVNFLRNKDFVLILKEFRDKSNMPLFFRHSLLDLSLEAILLSFPVKMEWGKSGNIIKILKIYIMLSCTHLYHFFPVSIQYLQCIHCLLHQMYEIYTV